MNKKHLGESGARELVQMVHDNADNIATLAEISEGLSAIKADKSELDTAYERTWSIPSYTALQELVRSGRHLTKLRYGDIFVIDAAEHTSTYSDGETTITADDRPLTEYRFKVIGRDEEELADPTLSHSLTLKCIEAQWPKRYNREALLVAQQAMPAGVYTVTVPADCGFKTEEAVFKIGVTQPLSAGDWVAFGNSATVSAGSPVRYSLDTSIDGVSFTGSFATADDLEEKGDQYTSLGNADGSVAGINFFAHALVGGSEYSLSDIKVWIGSDKSAAELEAEWASSAPYAIKPKSFDDGFLYLLDPDFVEILAPVKKKTLEYAIDGTATLVESVETAFLESYTEMMGDYVATWQIDGVDSGHVYEGSRYGYYNCFGIDMIDDDDKAHMQIIRSAHCYYNTPLKMGKYTTSFTPYAFPCVVIA